MIITFIKAWNKIRKIKQDVLMTKQIYLDFLQNVLEKQNPSDHYLNRYFVLKNRLIKAYGHSEKALDTAKDYLIKTGYLKTEHAKPLHVTEEGKKFFHQENQVHLMSWLEKFTQGYNKKGTAIVGGTSPFTWISHFHLQYSKKTCR